MRPENAGSAALLNELQALEIELHHPGAGIGRQRLEQLLHPDFHELGRSGRRYSRETVIGYLVGAAAGAAAAARPVVESRGFGVQLLADGCALLCYESVQRGDDGAALLPALRSSIWLRTAGGWQLAYHQGTPAATG